MSGNNKLRLGKTAIHYLLGSSVHGLIAVSRYLIVLIICVLILFITLASAGLSFLFCLPLMAYMYIKKSLRLNNSQNFNQ